MKLFDLLISRATRRQPDFIIGGAERPYMRRWWVIPRNRWFNIYLHQVLRPDDDRALHDHPWWNCSIVLRGGVLRDNAHIRPGREMAFPWINRVPPREGAAPTRSGATHRHFRRESHFDVEPLLVAVHHRPAHPRVGLRLPQGLGALEGFHQLGRWRPDGREGV